MLKICYAGAAQWQYLDMNSQLKQENQEYTAAAEATSFKNCMDSNSPHTHTHAVFWHTHQKCHI